MTDNKLLPAVRREPYDWQRTLAYWRLRMATEAILKHWIDTAKRMVNELTAAFASLHEPLTGMLLSFAETASVMRAARESRYSILYCQSDDLRDGNVLLAKIGGAGQRAIGPTYWPVRYELSEEGSKCN